ncbi:hypothetical protein FM120_01015 [Sphingobacterium faecium PCAi_F2.5]|nr:hypothetical protein FM120_01015 [Sphingobacterium faecium PCAi_F2.5]
MALSPHCSLLSNTVTIRLLSIPFEMFSCNTPVKSNCCI